MRLFCMLQFKNEVTPELNSEEFLKDHLLGQGGKPGFQQGSVQAY